jgi:hypothetical protein
VSPQRDPEPSAVPSGAQPRPSRAEPGTVSALKLDHELVEEMMSGLSKKDRAAFWRDHIDILGTAFLDRGMPREAVEAILSDHFEGVREAHRARITAKRRENYPIQFDAPPEIGTEIQVGKRVARLAWVEPITRKSDGEVSWVLHWNVDGRHATSGLRSAGFSYAKEGDDGQK